MLAPHTVPALSALVLSALIATTPAIAQTRLLTLHSPLTNARFGAAVASAGDVDGDGFTDIAVGAPLATPSAPLAGWAAVYSGRTGAALHALPGRAPEQSFGSAVAGIGDIDHDGRDDFAVGALGDSSQGTHAGRVYVFSGRTGTVLFDILGEGPGDLFGHALAAAGDVDRDGVPDFIVGAPENGDPIPNYGPGYAKVFSGRTGTVLHRFAGREVMFEQGHTVAGAGDIDGDGHADVVVGSVLDAWPWGGVGAARVYSGRTGAVLHTFRGSLRSDHFAMCVAGLGDVDGDGTPDIGVTAVELGTQLPGNVSVFSGRTGQRLRFAQAQAHMEMYGVGLCAVGDRDRDGYADYAVGAAGLAGGYGGALVYSGRDTALLGTVLGESQGAMFAFPIAAADINRDGFMDLVIGERGAHQGAGAVHVVSGVNVSPLGQGCSDHRPAPRLAATTPRIGQPWSLLLQHAAPLADAVVVASAVAPTPTVLWQGPCTFYLDWTTATFLLGLRTDGSGIALRQLPVPNAHGLVGQAFAVQAFMAAHTLPLAMSNGVALTFEH
jgi:hypothetical protein